MARQRTSLIRNRVLIITRKLLCRNRSDFDLRAGPTLPELHLTSGHTDYLSTTGWRPNSNSQRLVYET
jgi:hypothetical protein